jgi:hypothetical protein
MSMGGEAHKVLLLKAVVLLIAQQSRENATTHGADASSGDEEQSAADDGAQGGGGGTRGLGRGVGTDSDELNAGRNRVLSGPTVDFLVERFRLLCFVARDKAWWADPINVLPASALALTIPILAEHALVDTDARERLGSGGAVEAAVEMLVAMHGWGIPGLERSGAATGGAAACGERGDQPSTTPLLPTPDSTPAPVIRPRSASAARETPELGTATRARSDEEAGRGIPTAYCVARDLVRLVGNAGYQSLANQSMVLELGGVPVLLSRFLHDPNNPYIREWAIAAVRNLCEGNVRIQEAIASIEKDPSGVVTNQDLEDIGMEVTVDPQTGKLRTMLPKSPTPPPL